MTVRHAPLLLVFAAGCGSDWVPQDTIDTSIQQFPYYWDGDADGWGVIDNDHPAPQVFPEGGDGSYLALNARDCDDASASITGRTGSICPPDVGSDFEVVVYDVNEYLGTFGDSPRSYGAWAAGVCGPLGWGGGPARFDAADEIAQVDAIVGNGPWAGWIGVVANGSTWAWEDNGTEIGGTITIGSTELQYCNSSAPAVPDDVSSQRLALVKQANGTLCVGFPEDAGGPFVDGDAYAVCERVQPDPLAFARYTQDSGE